VACSNVNFTFYLYAVLVVSYTVSSSVDCCEIYVCVYHGYHSCILGVTFLMIFFFSLLVVAFCRCFCSMMY